jgi:ABC-2 type transport system ATP-binding protein
VARDYRRARRCLGVVPQELVFDPFFTVREVLRIQSGYFGLGRDNDDWIDELLDALMLGSKAHSNMRALSGGMKRRVLIAQALVHKPEVVILDEPTAGVDVELRNSLWGFVSRLHQEGHTIVLTTHYLEEAESLCDRIAIMNLGNIVALDDKQALLQRQIDHPRRLHVTLDKPVPPLSESLTERLISSQGNQLVLRLDAQESTVMELLEQIRDCGVDVVDVNCQLPDLEDIFLNLTMKPAQ